MLITLIIEYENIIFQKKKPLLTCKVFYLLTY